MVSNNIELFIVGKWTAPLSGPNRATAVGLLLQREVLAAFIGREVEVLCWALCSKVW